MRRGQACQTDRVSAIEFQAIDLFSRDEFLDRSRFGLKRGRIGDDFDSFTGGADTERRIYRESGCRIKFIVRGRKTFEAFGVDRDGVKTRKGCW